jgi:hypothetical protein
MTCVIGLRATIRKLTDSGTRFYDLKQIEALIRDVRDFMLRCPA